MTPFERRVRHAVYRHFIDTGAAPSAAELAEAVGSDRREVEDALRRLGEAHLVALRPGTLDIWMAHPFSAVPTRYPVRAGDRAYHANCAWDALGIPAMLGVDARTDTACPDCAEPLRIEVEGGRVTSDAGVVHFAVPPSRFWDDVGFT